MLKSFNLVSESTHDRPYRDNLNELDDYQNMMSHKELDYSGGSTDYKKSLYGLQINEEIPSQYDYTTWSTATPFQVPADTKSSISFSNSLLNPKALIKGSIVNNKVLPTPPFLPFSIDSLKKLDDEKTAMPYSSISNLLQMMPTSNTKSPSSLYSNFESKKTFNHLIGNQVREVYKEDHNKSLIKAHKETIPNSWSDLIIGRWPNHAKRFLELGKGKAEISSFRKGAMKNIDDFSTKKLRWLLKNRSKRDVNGKDAGR